MSVVGKSHVSYQYAVARLGVALAVGEKQVVFGGSGKAFVGQLGAPLAPLLHHQPRPRLAAAAAVWEKAQCEVPIGQLANFPCPLQCIDAGHLETCVHAAKITYQRVFAKDWADPLPLRFPIFLRGCTEKGKLSGAWCFLPFGVFVFHSAAYIAVETQYVRFCSRVKDARYYPAQQNYCLLHAHLFAPNYPLSHTKKALSHHLYPFASIT